jgi:hypothetical protein
MSSDVARLLTNLLNAADDGVLDQTGINARSPSKGNESCRKQVHRMHAREDARFTTLPEGSPDNVNDIRIHAIHSCTCFPYGR